MANNYLRLVNHPVKLDTNDYLQPDGYPAHSARPRDLRTVSWWYTPLGLWAWSFHRNLTCPGRPRGSLDAPRDRSGSAIRT